MGAPSEANLLAILARVARTLSACRVRWMVIGAWALGAWGRPRASLDFDFLVLAEDAGLARVVEALEARGMGRDRAWELRNPLLRGRQARLGCEGVSIDLLAPRDAHDREALERRRRKRIEGRSLWFVAPEDLILQKLKVGRPRDFEDALGVLARCCSALDRTYLERWAARLGLMEEWGYLTSR